MSLPIPIIPQTTSQAIQRDTIAKQTDSTDPDQVLIFEAGTLKLKQAGDSLIVSRENAHIALTPDELKALHAAAESAAGK